MAPPTKKRPRVISEDDDDTGDAQVSPVSSPGPAQSDDDVGVVLVESADDDADTDANGVGVGTPQKTRRRRIASFRADQNYLQGIAESIDRYVRRMATRQTISQCDERYVRFVVRAALRFLLQRTSQQLVEDLQLDTMGQATLTKYQYANYEFALREMSGDLSTRDDVHRRIANPSICTSPPTCSEFPRNHTAAKWADRFAKAIEKPETFGDTMHAWVEKMRRAKTITQKDKEVVNGIIDQIVGFLEQCEYARTFKAKTLGAVDEIVRASGDSTEGGPADVETLNAGVEELLRWIENAQTKATSDVLNEIQSALTSYSEYGATKKKFAELMTENSRLQGVLQTQVRLVKHREEEIACLKKELDMHNFNSHRYIAAKMEEIDKLRSQLQLQQRPSFRAHANTSSMNNMNNMNNMNLVRVLEMQPQPQPQPSSSPTPTAAPTAATTPPQQMAQLHWRVQGREKGLVTDATLSASPVKLFVAIYARLYGYKNNVGTLNIKTDENIRTHCYVQIERLTVVSKAIETYVGILESEFGDPSDPGNTIDCSYSTRFTGTHVLLRGTVTEALSMLTMTCPDDKSVAVRDAFDKITPSERCTYAKCIILPIMKCAIANLNFIQNLK